MLCRDYGLSGSSGYYQQNILCISIVTFTHNRKEPDIFTYVENHKENFYLMDMYIASKNFDKPMLKAEIPDNSITTSWMIGSAFAKQVQEKYYVKNLYGDLVDNSHAFYLSWAGEEHIRKLERYYNAHYSNGRNNIVLEQIEDEGIKLYRICTKK